MFDFKFFYTTSLSYMNYKNLGMYNKLKFWISFPKAYYIYYKLINEG